MNDHHHCHHCANKPVNGRQLCPIDGRNIAWHARAGYCPAAPPRFGDGIKPERWDTVPRPPLPVVELTDEQIEEERRRLKAGGCCGAPSG